MPYQPSSGCINRLSARAPFLPATVPEALHRRMTALSAGRACGRHCPEGNGETLPGGRGVRPLGQAGRVRQAGHVVRDVTMTFSILAFPPASGRRVFLTGRTFSTTTRPLAISQLCSSGY